MTPAELHRNRRREMDRIGRRRRQLEQLAGRPTNLTPAAPIRARLNALHDLGWSYEALAAWHGAGTAAGLNLIASGVSHRCEQKFAAVANLPLTLRVPDTVGDNMWVPTLGATRRIQALLALGWRHADITEQIGRSSHSLAGGTYLRTTAIDWRIVDAAYERMSAARGDSTRTAQRAAARGYAVPFVWHDIDDPTERARCARPRVERDIPADPTVVDPVAVERIMSGEWRLPCTPAEKAAVCALWLADGGGRNELARRTGWRVQRYIKGAA